MKTPERQLAVVRDGTEPSQYTVQLRESEHTFSIDPTSPLFIGASYATTSLATTRWPASAIVFAINPWPAQGSQTKPRSGTVLVSSSVTQLGVG